MRPRRQPAFLFFSVLLAFGALGTQAQSPEPRRFAILVGINQYADPGLVSLQKAQNDAEDLGKALSRLGGYKSVTVMSGGLPFNDLNFPGKNKIVDRVLALADIVKPEDQVLFFFSGHGVNDRSGESYLLPIDARIKDPTGTGIDLQNDILAPLQNAGVKNIVCLVDACQKTVAKDKGIAIVGVNDFKATSRAVVITATGKGKASYEDPKGANGLFTRSILAAFNGEADFDRDGFLSVAELESYLPDAVSEYAFNVGMSQKPAVFDSGSGSLQPALARVGAASGAAAMVGGGAGAAAAGAATQASAAPTAKAQFVSFKVPDGIRVDLRLLGSDGREIKSWSDTASFSEKVEPGSYRVEAQDRSYLHYPFSAMIAVGLAKVAVALDLKPNFGSLSLTCDPSEGVDVLLNGEKRGTLNGGALKIERLKSGSYELVVSRELYDIKRQSIQIEDGKVAQVKLSLSPNFFTLSVSEKTGMAASLYVDGQSRGALPQTLKLPFRSVALRVVPADPRYKEWSDSVQPGVKGSAEKRVAVLEGRRGSLEVTTIPDAEAELSLTPLGASAGAGAAQKIGTAPLDYEALIGDYELGAAATVGGKKLVATAKVTLREGQTSPVRLELKDATLGMAEIPRPAVSGLSAIARQVTGNPDFDVGRQYAVIIGISKYREWPSLLSADSEARAVRKALADRYYIDEFLELYNEDATASNIRRLFVDTLPAKVGLRDSLLVFYAGHSRIDASRAGFWIASDGSRDPMSQSGWIPNAQLRNMIGLLKAQRILILADSDFSGDFLNVSRGSFPSIDSGYFSKALQLCARQVLCSGNSETVLGESEFGRMLISILEHNEEPLLDTISMYERIRLGVARSIPLIGTLPGHQQGASFVLFNKSLSSR